MKRKTIFCRYCGEKCDVAWSKATLFCSAKCRDAFKEIPRKRVCTCGRKFLGTKRICPKCLSKVVKSYIRVCEDCGRPFHTQSFSLPTCVSCTHYKLKYKHGGLRSPRGDKFQLISQRNEVEEATKLASVVKDTPYS